MEIEYPEPNSNLGERLLAGIRNLWTRVKELEASQRRAGKVADHQGEQIERIKRELMALRAKIRGLKISRGKALAKNARLARQVAEAESGLTEIEHQIH
jgi:chromosome segregation ATPase